MRSTRLRRSKMCRKNSIQKIKAIIIIAVLFFTIILSSFQSFILESSASSDNNDGYKNVPVTWSRTKEVTTDRNGNINGGYVDARNNSYNFWMDKTGDDGINYDFFGKNTASKSGVLRTDRLLIGSNKVLLNYDTLLGDKGIIKPTESVKVWDGKSSDRYFSDYSPASLVNSPRFAAYTEYATWSHKGLYDNCDQWRAFKGDFSDDDLQIKDKKGNNISNKRVYVGVNITNPELILPVNDYIIILVDGQVTKMNFSTQSITEMNKDNISFLTKDLNDTESIQKVEFQSIYFCKNWGHLDQKYKCNDPIHFENSIHTDTWHAHLDDKVNPNDGGNLRLGDITEYLNPNLSNHKIEIISGDYSGGGGMSKLQVYTTEEPETKVEKVGYTIKNGVEIDLEDNDLSAELYCDDEVYYKFKITNESNVNLPKANIVFEDETLGIKINKEGIYKKNQTDGAYEKVSSSSLVIKRNNGSPIIGENGLSALYSLNANGSIEVECKEYLKHIITDNDVQSGIYKNTVVGTVEYFNSSLKLSKEDTFTVHPKYPTSLNAEILKTVDKVIRNNEVIFPKTGVVNVPELKPEDKVTFNIKLTNLSNRSTGLLTLEDNLQAESYSENEWQYKEGSTIFNPKGFILKGNEIKVISTEWTVITPVKGKLGDYNPLNTAYLKLGDTVQMSEVKLSLKRPTLKIMKRLSQDSLEETDKDKTFTISIKGDDNTTFNVEATINKEYTIDNLEYGVKYTILEIIPMNYQGIDSKEVLMSRETDNSLIYIDNKKINNEHFYDDDIKTNTFYMDRNEEEIR